MRIKRHCVDLFICTPFIKAVQPRQQQILHCARLVPTLHAPSNGLIERSKPPDRIEKESGCVNRRIVRKLPCRYVHSVAQPPRARRTHMSVYGSQWAWLATLHLGERIGVVRIDRQ